MKLDIQMFAVPFHRVSKTRKRLRRSHNAMEVPGMTKCPNCGSYKGKVELSKEAE